jgi:hypothetical protein
MHSNTLETLKLGIYYRVLAEPQRSNSAGTGVAATVVRPGGGSGASVPAVLLPLHLCTGRAPRAAPSTAPWRGLAMPPAGDGCLILSSEHPSF